MSTRSGDAGTMGRHAGQPWIVTHLTTDPTEAHGDEGGCRLRNRPTAPVAAVLPLCDCDGEPHFGVNLQMPDQVLRIKLTVADLLMMVGEVQRYAQAQGVAEIAEVSPQVAIKLVMDVEEDSAQIQDQLKSLSEAAERSVEVREGLLDLLHAGGQVFAINSDDKPAAAGELRVRLQLSDRLRVLAST